MTHTLAAIGEVVAVWLTLASALALGVCRAIRIADQRASRQ